MMRFLCYLTQALLLIFFVSCGSKQPPKKASDVKTPSATSLFPTAVRTVTDDQPIYLRQESMRVGDKTIFAELADTQETRSRGLMFRKNMDRDSGMLFIFESPTMLHFYMKNTYIPLSIAFIREDLTIESIHDMIPLRERPTYDTKEPCLYALEMNQGWFKENGISVGASITLPQGLRKQSP